MWKWTKFTAATVLVVGAGLFIFVHLRGSPTADAAALIDRADTVVVFRDNRDRPTEAYSSTARADLDALKAALRLRRGDGQCKCGGNPRIDLYENGRNIGTISNQHGKAVRLTGWSDDLELIDPEPLFKWLSDRGVADAQREFDETEARRKASRTIRERWDAAAPPALQSLWERAAFNKGATDVTTLVQTHARAVPDVGERIRSLFEWYGSGAGAWSGFPHYEAIAEDMLLTYPTSELVAAAVAPLTPAQMEGAARLFGGWGFNSRRKDDAKQLTAELKATLWRHCETTTDQDKLGRARAAFGS